MPTVEFLAQKKKINIGKYANLRQAALLKDVEIYSGIDRMANCKGHGACGTCTMEIVEGKENLSPPTLLEKLALKGMPDNVRLSCQAEVLGDICVITSFSPKPSRQ